MKKFLFPTDFSANAKHALNYGYSLAKQAKANIIICNAVIEPAEIPQAGLVSWPMEESDLLMQNSTDELKFLKENLESKEQTVGFNPSINYENETGTLIDMVNKLGNNRDIDLVIVGTHGSSGLSTFLLGNHSRQMIDEINKPLLLVPPATPITRVKKIAFATDFKNLVKDMECLHQLIGLARPLNAEILITHILNEDQHTTAFQYIIDQFMTEISGKANYPNIYYRELKSSGSVAGLDWLCKHGDIDMLAMVHRPHNFIDSMFRGSQTQKMAGHIPVPLLVFPC